MTEANASSGWKTFAIVFCAVLLAILLGGMLLKWYLFPSNFTPVTLSSKEEQVLQTKLRTLGYQPEQPTPGAIEPEAYTEVGASREVSFSEKEINALVAKKVDIANRVAIDFSESLASAKVLIPLDPDFPLFGGETLRINAGVELGFSQDRPIVKLRGVSLWGVPVPNAWLGDLKNVDLVKEFGGQAGFWQSFAAGIDLVEVREGSLFVRLKE